MTEQTWEVGDQFRANAWPRKGYFTGTVVQVLDDGKVLFGYWRVVDGKKVAAYGLKTPDRYDWSKKEPKLSGPSKKYTAQEAADLFVKANAAGVKAGAAAIPVPMVVGTPKNMMASLMGGDDGGFDENEPTYFVNEGACGFAWVTIYPGTSSLAKQWTKLGLASPAYKGGTQVWVRYGGQSVARKAAYAEAFARVLTDEGITAYSGSGLD